LKHWRGAQVNGTEIYERERKTSKEEKENLFKKVLKWRKERKKEKKVEIQAMFYFISKVQKKTFKNRLEERKSNREQSER
jgi:hypothetical protein